MRGGFCVTWSVPAPSRDITLQCPAGQWIRIRTILTDNGKEFMDRLFGLRKRAATGAHEFDTLCAALDIEHRLTPPRSPQTNGMVERFPSRAFSMHCRAVNGRI